MKLAGWLLIACGLCSPILTTYFADANRGAAGYASGTGYLISIVAIIVTLISTRSSAPQKRRAAYLIVGVIVFAAGAWSSFQISQAAMIEREIAAARPEINRIMQAAVKEARLRGSGQIPEGAVSSDWQPFANPTSSISLSDSRTPLHIRFVEAMRRAKARELDLARSSGQALSASGVGTALASDQLMSATSRAESLRRLDEYRRFINSYEQRLQALEEQSRADVRALHLPATTEGLVLGGNRRASSETEAAVRRFVDSEAKTLNAIDTLIKFVDAHAASLRQADGQLMFSETAAQAEYESMRAELAGSAPSR